MHTAPITTTPADASALPPPAMPGAPGTPSFSDMLASATSSLAAFALLPTSSTTGFSGAATSTPPAPKKDPNTDNAAAPIALPTPVQSPAPTSNDASGASSSTPPAASAAAGSPSSQPASTSATSPAGTSTGPGGTSSGSAQTTGGVALPQMAAELNTKIALGAQALLSQPTQTLATLPHGALPAGAAPALAPSLGGGAHGATAPDPTAVLPKLATNATIAAATPSTTPTTLETALPSTTPTSGTPAATTAAGEAAVLATASDTSSDPGANPATLAATPTPVAVPTPADAAASPDAAPPSLVAASALDQVAASLKQSGKLGLSQIEIQLKPASLGAVDVKLELTHDGRVAAVISADRSDTLMQLQRGSGELQQALRDAGLQTDSGSLSFNLRGDAQTSDQSGRQPSYAAPQQGTASGASDDILAVPVAMTGASPSSHSGLLNIQV